MGAVPDPIDNGLAELPFHTGRTKCSDAFLHGLVFGDLELKIGSKARERVRAYRWVR